MIRYISPTLIELEEYDSKFDELDKLLTFSDQKIIFEIQRMKNAHWYINIYGEEKWREKIEDLKGQQKRSLLIQKDGKLLTYSGLANRIAKHFNDQIINDTVYPEPEFIKFERPLRVDPRYYQLEAVKRLIEAKQGSISLPTGAGKSLILLLLAKELGLKTVVMAPSISITKQLYKEFRHHFGDKKVSLYSSTKRNNIKQITIFTGKSLSMIPEDSKSWKALQDTQVFIADESHLCPAATLEKVCLDLLQNVPYRFFVSATQMRNDGSDLLLEGIINNLVLELPAKQLIDEGFLAKPNFKILKSKSFDSYYNKNSLKMIDRHVYKNKYLHQQAAELANKSVEILGHQVLIMLDKIEQFNYIINYLKYECKFAHGGLNASQKKIISALYHEKDVDRLVEEFNASKFPILVGTPCIGLGTNIQSVKTIINLQAGKSEVKFTQLVGRGTRIVDGKKEFNFIDFDIEPIDLMHRHLEHRVKIYDSFYPNVKFI